LLLGKKRVEAWKNKLARELHKSHTRFVLIGEDVGNVKSARDMLYPGILKADAVMDTNLTNIHVAKAFRKRCAATPVNGAPVVVIKRGGVSDIRETEIIHDVLKHLNCLGPFIHGVDFGLV
jgi:hypothetical protein